MFSTVVVGVNGGAGGRDAAALASVLAGPDARLTFVHVRFTDVLPEQDVVSSPASDLLAGERDTAGRDACTVAAHSVGEGLERIAAERGADLIVIGACERGPVGRVLVGDDAASVLHQTRRAVAVASREFAGSSHSIGRIGVAFDGSAESEIALAEAETLAGGLGASLVARCVVTPHVMATGIAAGAAYMEDPEDLVARTRAALGRRGDTTEIIVGPIETELAAFSGEVDLLVCGSRHNSVLRRVALGSTSAYLAHHSKCPLLVAAAPVGPETGRAGQAPAAHSVSDR